MAPDDQIRRRDVARLLAGRVARGLGELSAVTLSLTEAAASSLGASSASTSSADGAPSILGRDAGGSMWVRGRIADPGIAPKVEVSDGTALLRLLREGDVHAGPLLAPLTGAALAGTARSVASMDVDARTNALFAIADLIGRARPGSGAVRVALARGDPILGSGQPASVVAARLDALADELAADIREGNTRISGRLRMSTSSGIFLAGSWSRQSLGDPWLVADLLSDGARAIVAHGGATGEGDLIAGWVDPTVRSSLEVVPDDTIAATLRAGRCDVVLLLAEDVRADGSVIAAPGSLAVALLARHYGIAVVAVDVVSAFSGAVIAGGPSPDVDELGRASVDLVPPGLIAEIIAAGPRP